MVESLEELLRSEPGRFFPGGEAPGRLGFLLVKGSLGALGGRVTFLVFRDGAASPCLAAKLSRDPCGDAALKVEAASLKKLAGLAAGSAVPRLLFEGPCGGVNMIVEEAVEGTPLMAGLAGGGAAAGIEAAARWLGELGEQSASGPAPDGRVRASVELFRRLYLPGGGAATLLESLAPGFDALERGCRRVFSHNDFSPMNVYLGASGVRVIDWAEAGPAGFPLHDLFMLLASLSPAGCDGPGRGRAWVFREVFFRGGRYHSLLSGAVPAAWRGKLERGLELPLLALFLMERANREHEVLSGQGRRGYIVPMAPLPEGARWADGSLQRGGLYARLLDELAGDPGLFSLS